ncbi:hypothetical protein [Nocardia sp. NBC_01327]|uniref:hypothetical protein n=1 Tax=Nocardia sp. NBC_01327 TaxID=2903593 RepID=UPI002E115046|nr:hypothetical protein OG326_23820 [Nocardia sp. NBC_01327]
MGMTAIPAPNVDARPVTSVAAATINTRPADDTLSKSYDSDAVPSPSAPAVSIVGTDGSM